VRHSEAEDGAGIVWLDSARKVNDSYWIDSVLEDAFLRRRFNRDRFQRKDLGDEGIVTLWHVSFTSSQTTRRNTNIIPILFCNLKLHMYSARCDHVEMDRRIRLPISTPSQRASSLCPPWPLRTCSIASPSRMCVRSKRPARQHYHHHHPDTTFPA
jgi:hypothetical protein